jgi:hypothetical protein
LKYKNKKKYIVFNELIIYFKIKYDWTNDLFDTKKKEKKILGDLFNLLDSYINN